MNKRIYAFLILLGAVSIAFVGCDKNTEEPEIKAIVQEVSDVKNGQIITREFLVGDEIMASVDDKAVNYGTEGSPAIFFIHEKTNVEKEGYKGILSSVKKENLERLVQLWRKMYEHYFELHEMETAPYSHFLNYLITNKLDITLFLRMIENIQDLKSVVNIVESVNMQSTRANGELRANDVLRKLYTQGISIGELSTALQQKGHTINDLVDNPNILYTSELSTKGDVLGDVVDIFKSLKESIGMWIDFANNNGPVVDFNDNYYSVLNSQDTNWKNYRDSKSLKSSVTQNYTLRYKVSRDMFAEVTYHFDYEYSGKHSSKPNEIQGYYVPKFNMICDFADAKGPKFSVAGKVKYEHVGFIGSFDDPDNLSACSLGEVQVSYGDCCCCHFYSYMNLNIMGKDGLVISSFGSGR